MKQDPITSSAVTNWPLIYTSIRRLGLNHHDAEDLTQAYILHLTTRERGMECPGMSAEHLLNYHTLCARTFALSELRKGNTQKRGGRHAHVLLSDLTDEPRTTASPDSVIEKREFQELVDREIDVLESEYAKRGKGEVFAMLKPHLLLNEACPPYREIAGILETKESNLPLFMHRARAKLKDRLRALLKTPECPWSLCPA